MIVGENQGLGTASPRSRHSQVRLGVIDYLNVRPVYEWILRAEPAWAGGNTVQPVSGVPAAMNAALASGAVDVSNVSSVAYGSHVRDWLLIPRLSVAAHGRVDSVLLFSRFADWSALDGRSIAVTDQSATSIALVRLLCGTHYGVHPTYVTMAGDLETMLAEHDAALIIGDTALLERHLQRSFGSTGRPFCFDLATEWTTWTGLPFVFAVWAARAEHVEALRASGVIDLLRVSKERGLARLDAIAAEYSVRLGLPHAVCAEYLRLLDYDLSERDLQGLRSFLELALPDFRWNAVRFYED